MKFGAACKARVLRRDDWCWAEAAMSRCPLYRPRGGLVALTACGYFLMV
jgi:hypothetical protein